MTWEESKSHLALYAVTSQALFLSNDLRPGYVQPRLLGLFMNKDMLKVNQQYAGFAGDRLWTGRSCELMDCHHYYCPNNSRYLCRYAC